MTHTQLAEIKRNIAHACDRAQRPSDAVQLLAVSKRQTPTAIKALYDQGQRLFGENYVSEALEKMSQTPADIEWHFIGPIQSNKTRSLAENFSWVQSVDRSKILDRLNEQRPAKTKPLNICLQINISGETSKSGCSVDELAGLVEHVTQHCPNLVLRGLMAIPSKEGDKVNLEQQFSEMQSLFNSLQKQVSSVDTLSMGMSSDYDTAIHFGSTMVRIGTALFGARKP